MKRQKLKKRKVNMNQHSAPRVKSKETSAGQKKREKAQKQFQQKQAGKGGTNTAQRPARPVNGMDARQRAAQRRAIEMQQLLQDIPQAQEKNKKRMRDQARAENSRRHKKRRWRNRSLYYILILFFVLITGITLSVTVFFNIKTMTVTGGGDYTAEELAQIGNVAVGDNLFRLNLSRMEEDILKQSIDIDEISIKRSLPETLRFEVTPASPALAVYFEKQYYILSSGGRLIAVSESPEGYEELIIVTGIDLSKQKIGSFVNSSEDYQEANDLLESLSAHELGSVNGISMKNGVEIKVNIGNRICLQIGSAIGLEDKLLLARQLLAEEISESETGVLDVSESGKAYFRPMNEEELVKELPKGKTGSTEDSDSPEAEPKG